MDIAAWYRLCLIGLTLFVVAVFILQSLYSWKHLSIGQKLFVTGAICFMLYVSDAAREAIQADIGFRWRLVPWTIGVIAYFVYILEPQRSKMRRFGGDIFDAHD